MKNLFVIGCVFVLAFGCTSQETSVEDNQPPKEETVVAKETEKTAPAKPAEETESFLGYYVGQFKAETYKNNKQPSYSNKITISIDSIKNKILYGHSVVAGNIRPFIGPVTIENIVAKVTAKEPGDDRYDGTFSFVVNNNSSRVIGSWESNDKNLAVTERLFTLEKREFAYDPNLKTPDLSGLDLYQVIPMDTDADGAEFITEYADGFNASTTELKKEDLENMYKADLEIIRNSIYARHGYSFKNRRMRYVFDDHVDWYMPVKTNIVADLTPLERKNIELLKRYEDHAEKYYDTFGR